MRHVVPPSFQPMRVDLGNLFPLRSAHIHEVYGPVAMSFAAISVGDGALWIREGWLSDMITPQGLLRYLNPARLLLARPKNQIDSLAVAEEVLEDGVLPDVILELTRPLDLREGRLPKRAGQRDFASSPKI